VNVPAIPAGDGRAAGRLDPNWWTRALTPDERDTGEHPSRPSWADVAERAVAAAAPRGARPPADERRDALTVPLWPFLAEVRGQLADRARHCLPSGQADPGRLADSYTVVLEGRLVRIAHRTLAVELAKSLAGADGRVDTASFVTRLSTPPGLAWLFGEYPVLARLLGVVSQQAAEAGLELLARPPWYPEPVTAGLSSSPADRCQDPARRRSSTGALACCSPRSTRPMPRTCTART